MRRFCGFLLFACLLQTTVWGQTPPPYNFREKVEIMAVYGSKSYLDPQHSWCMPADKGKKVKVRGIVELDSDSLKFTQDKDATESCTIQYKDIVTLSRGDIATPTPDPTITAATGLGSLLAGVLKGTVTKSEPGGKSTTTVSGPWLGATIGLAGVAVLFASLSYKHAYKANYIAISYNEMPIHHKLQGCQAEGDLDQSASSLEQPGKGDPKAATPQEKPGQSPTLFYKGNVVVFRLPSRDDYWEASMILSSATGCEFVSEEAEKK